MGKCWAIRPFAIGAAKANEFLGDKYSGTRDSSQCKIVTRIFFRLCCIYSNRTATSVPCNNLAARLSNSLMKWCLNIHGDARRGAGVDADVDAALVVSCTESTRSHHSNRWFYSAPTGVDWLKSVLFVCSTNCCTSVFVIIGNRFSCLRHLTEAGLGRR